MVGNASTPKAKTVRVSGCIGNLIPNPNNPNHCKVHEHLYARILQPVVEAAQQSNGHAPVEEAEDEDPDDANISDDESLDQ